MYVHVQMYTRQIIILKHHPPLRFQLTSVLQELFCNMWVHRNRHDVLVFDVWELDGQLPLESLKVERLHGLAWPSLHP